jgi:6-phosphogluconolactonase
VSGSPFTTGGNGTYGVAISLNNRFLYATNVSSNTITVYSINPLTGALSMVSSPMTTDSTRPNGLFVHPTGQYLYVSNFTGNNMSAYRIGSDGLLSQVTGSPFSASGAQRLNGVTGTADGAYLYAAAGGVASGTNGIVAYSIDQSTGALTVLPGTPFKTSNGATNARGDGISIHPNGRWVYMGLYGQRSMASWEINASTGTLTPINAVSNTVAPGYNDDGGSASIVSADGLYLYGTAYSRTNEANSEKIITYTIDQTTGAVSRITDVSTEGGPNDIRIDTTGNYAYTCNTVSSPSISAYSVNKTTGALTPLTPAYYSIPTSSYGPGIMVMQINR